MAMTGTTSLHTVRGFHKTTNLNMHCNNFLLLYFACPARALLMSSFTRVFHVPLSDYVDNVLAVDKNSSSPIECATTCDVDCYSFTHDEETRECKTYSKELCTDVGVNQSSVIQTFVRKRKDHVSDPTKCSDVNPAYCSGVYRVTLTSGLSTDVYCDMNTDEGPWAVIQNRQDGQVDFYRNWTDYKKGFGDLNGNFWAGLDVIHLLTQTISTLRIELVSWHGDTAYAQYSFFSIADESSKYRLSVSGFSGNVSYDAMAYHNGFQFTTEDNDNSAIGYCALSASGAWWYKSCYDSNLNGPYVPDTRDIYKSMAWYRFYTGRDHVPLMKTRMLVKESDVYL